MSGGAAGRAVMLAVALLLLAGCGEAPAPPTATPSPMTTEASDPAPVVNATPPPPPAPVSPFEPGNEPAAGAPGAPRFAIPEVWPGRRWSNVSLEAEMPAGTWLFLYVPLPPGTESVSDDLPLEFTASGAGNGSGPAARLVFAPFLVQDDKDGQVRETYLAESAAALDTAGANWTFRPTRPAVTPFGGTRYAGIAALAAASTPWHLHFRLDGPWEGGEGTVGPERVAWGHGFSATRLPAVATGGTGGTDGRLDWQAPFSAGALAVQAASSCYRGPPCADPVVQEDWTFAFPGGNLTREFHRTPTSGTAPTGLFGTLDGPAGPLAVHGTVQGLTGARAIDVFHAPLPHKAWPFPLTDARFG